MEWIVSLTFTLFILNVEAFGYSQQINAANFLKLSSKSTKFARNSQQNSAQCRRELDQFELDLANNEPSATRLIDTWAKVDSGYLSGNTFNYGDFDSCVNFQPLNTQYCLVALSPLPNSTISDERTDLSLKHFANFLRNNNIVPLNGFCLPKSCSFEEMRQFLNQKFLFANDLIAVGGMCRDMTMEFDFLFYAATTIFSLIVLIIIASTVYDIIKSKSKDGEPNKLYVSFSFYTNGYKLFDVTKIKSASSLNCLHGIRAMSIFWIIIGHRIFNQFPWGNPLDMIEFFNNQTIMASVILAYTLAVDTFLVMGAILMTWSTLRDCEKEQLNIARMIWRRYLRYTPVYAALILLIVAYSDKAFRGPLYTSVFKDPCIANWWAALLHIQNYFHQEDMCMNHGWYLSVDFQLFIISPFIIWLIHKYGRLLLGVPAALCLATIIYIITITIVHEISLPPDNSGDGYMKYIYFVTHSRAGPWFIGMILGYFLYIYRGRKFEMNKLVNATLWIVSISILFAVILLQYAIMFSAEPVHQAIHTSYITLSRNLWGIGICWIVFACQNLKTGGIIRWFLSLPQWQPISRMGLSMYLFGAAYQIVMGLNQRVLLYMNFWSVFPLLISDIAIIAMLSALTYLAFEVPPMIIEDYIYKKFKGKEA